MEDVDMGVTLKVSSCCHPQVLHELGMLSTSIRQLGLPKQKTACLELPQAGERLNVPSKDPVLQTCMWPQFTRF